MSVRRRLLHAVNRVYLAFSRERLVHGMRVWQYRRKGKVSERAFARVAEAIALIDATVPRTGRRVRRDLRGVWLFMSASEAEYLGRWRMCVIDTDVAAKPETTVAALAILIVHEAMHGRLSDRGVRYPKYDPERIERTCIRAGARFAAALPFGEPLAAMELAKLDRETNLWTAAELQGQWLRKLEEIDAPRWLLRWAVRRVSASRVQPRPSE